MESALEAKGLDIGIGVPDFYIGAVTYFSQRAGNAVLRVRLADPPTDSGHRMPYDGASYFREYYGLITDLLSSSNGELIAVGDGKARVVTMEALDLSIGLDDRLLSLIASIESPEFVQRVLQEVYGVSVERRFEIEPREPGGQARIANITPDGVVMVTGPTWS